MSFFDEYAEGDGGDELHKSEAGRQINFSGKDGEYSEKCAESGAVTASATVDKVIAAWHLDGRVLWPGSGSIPKDGDAPLCRNEKATLDIACLNQKAGPATLATMAALGYTGNCQDCRLAQFNGQEKPLCRQTATLYVADPGVEITPDTIHRLVFSGPSVVKVLREKIGALHQHAKAAGKSYAQLVVRLGSEKVISTKKKSDSYRVPTFSVDQTQEMDAGWVAALGVEARIVINEARRRPSWARDPRSIISAPAVQAALMAGREAVGIDEIPF